MTDGAFRHGLLPHALCALRDHLLLTSGEDLVIAWDETVSRELYHALRDAATFLGNRVTCMVYEPVAYRDIREYGRFAGRSIAKPLLLPRPLRGALSGCDPPYADDKLPGGPRSSGRYRRDGGSAHEWERNPCHLAGRNRPAPSTRPVSPTSAYGDCRARRATNPSTRKCCPGAK